MHEFLQKSIKFFLSKSLPYLCGKGLSRYTFLMTPYSHLVRSLKTPQKVVEIQGNKMFLDKNDTLELSLWGVYEPLETKLFMNTLKKDDIVVDIGAHIGYYTLIAAKIIGIHGRVYAFEPDPANFELLEKNIDHNSYANVIIEKKAVGDTNDKIRLYLSNNNTGDHRIYNFDDKRRSVEIEAICLDDYFKGYESTIDLIKMDVQGAEGIALQGMKNVLTLNKKLKVLMEFTPEALLKCHTDPEGLLKEIIGYGYKIYLIDDREQKLQAATIVEVMNKCEVLMHVNLFLSHN